MKWEYLSGVTGDYVGASQDYVFVGAIINEEHRRTFNELGNGRWELVTIIKEIAYFKRPVQPETSEEQKRLINYFRGKVD